MIRKVLKICQTYIKAEQRFCIRAIGRMYPRLWICSAEVQGGGGGGRGGEGNGGGGGMSLGEWEHNKMYSA